MRMNSKRVWQIMEPAQGGDRASRVFDLSIAAVILAAVLGLTAESVGVLRERYWSVLGPLEAITLTIFAVEYLTRLWACRSDARYSGSWGRLRWAVSPMAVIDLLAVLPGLVTFGLLDLRFLRTLRLLRLLRLGRYSKGMQLIGMTLRRSKDQLFVALSAVLVLLFMASAALYLAENKTQPDQFGSIPQAMWWGVATLTTVGYGDVYPVTPSGKVLASIVAILGIGTFALPAGILASNFQRCYLGDDCPHCGRKIR